MTADSGPDSMLVVWDSQTATPVKTFFNPHENGVLTMDISEDAMYIVTLSNEDKQQKISLWDWTNEDLNDPLVTRAFEYNKEDKQIWVKFNQSNVKEIVSNGRSRVFFLNWESDMQSFDYYSP